MYMYVANVRIYHREERERERKQKKLKIARDSLRSDGRCFK